MIHRGRGVSLAWAVLGVLASLVATVLTMRSGGSAPRPAGAAPSGNAFVGANAFPLAESIPPPPSFHEIYDDAQQLSPRCEALRSTNQRLLEESTQRLGTNPPCSIPLVAASLGCVTTDNGVTWGYRLATATAALPKNDARENFYHCSSKLRFELLREKRADARVVPGAEVRLEVAYDEELEVSLEALSDYDGDGEPELLKTVYRKAHEGEGIAEVRVLTYRAGRMQEYAPSRGLPIDRAEDVDGDGLIDLMTAGPYRSIKAQSDIGASYAIAPSLFAYHAQRDGTFAMPTPASLAYAEGRCPERDVPELAATDSGLDNAGELARKLICARLWGADAARIEARFRTVCPKSYEQYERDFIAQSSQSQEALAADAGDAGDAERVAIQSCREWVLQLARVKPPFTLVRSRP